ncbi:MAG: DUF89 family protein [Candidatus Hydrogenedentes bacterium]|nr:DUF89 family protein [Candidatus Hydrogenedentota bacterium]
MNIYHDCVACLIRQTVEAGRLATADLEIQDRILRAVLGALAKRSFDESPAHIAREVHQLVQGISGNPDPYKEVKTRANNSALAARRACWDTLPAAAKSLERAVLLAIAGNAMDIAPKSGRGNLDIMSEIGRLLSRRIDSNSLENLRRASQGARRILYLGDNAGEIVFDRILIEMLPAERITYAVKAKPILNDATLLDAQAAGLPEIVEVIDNGSDAPGTILDTCSPEFCKRFDESDLVIAKGQANYETLCDVDKDGLYFLLLVKCPVLARDIGANVDDVVVRNAKSRPARTQP